MTNIKNRAKLALEAVNSEVDLVVELDKVKNYNQLLIKELLLAIAQMESDKWYKPEILRVEQGIDKTLSRLRRLLVKYE